MIADTRDTAGARVHTLFVGKDSGFAAETFTDQYKRILGEHRKIQSLAYLEQVHGDRAVGVYPGARGLHFAGEGDALYTSEPDTALLIRTADCIPVLFYSKTQPQIGAVHAGWRGLKAKILSKTLADVGAADLEFVIGPFIGAKSYEVGEDVSGAFAAGFSESRGGGKFFLNLKGILEAELRELGVAPQRVTWYDHDTLTADAWYSARRDDLGRNLALIWFEKT